MFTVVSLKPRTFCDEKSPSSANKPYTLMRKYAHSHSDSGAAPFDGTDLYHDIRTFIAVPFAMNNNKRKIGQSDETRPVDVAVLPAISPSPLLKALIDDLGRAPTSYAQLSVLQKLKAQVIEQRLSPSEHVTAMPQALAYLLQLYLLPSAKHLRKTLVGLVAAFGAALGEQAAVLGEEATARFLASCVDMPLSSRHSIADTSADVSSFLGALELPLLADSLLASSANIDRCMAFLGARLTLHMRSLSELASGVVTNRYPPCKQRITKSGYELKCGACKTYVRYKLDVS